MPTMSIESGTFSRAVRRSIHYVINAYGELRVIWIQYNIQNLSVKNCSYGGDWGEMSETSHLSFKAYTAGSECE
jgi:hypothetical protein